MDVLFWLKRRTSFIRFYYDTAESAFADIRRRIEWKEPPFDDPPYSEDPEPPFTEQWEEAATGSQVLAETCNSMLSGSLKLFFVTLEKQLGIQGRDEQPRPAFKNGFLRGYKEVFAKELRLSWEDCPADFDLLEQVILARHRTQHPESITSINARHSAEDKQKYPNPVFVNRWLWDDEDELDYDWIKPAVYITRENLFLAIQQVELLAAWLYERIPALRNSR